MGIYYCFGKRGESEKRLGDRKEREDNVHARRAPRLQKSQPEQGGGYRMFTPPSTSLDAKGLRLLGVGWGGVAYSLGPKWDLFFRGS